MTQENNTPVSVEQMFAAVVATIGTIEIPVQSLLADYSKKSISVNQDPETQNVIFNLVDAPATEQNVAAE